eukprot:TRINITY_DN1972_c0_g1_i1.p1 TRINITY_DN1972_c0_g1~~TRINITY_DN1972_c0_g1_i1.p1  ORF type:complete len:117 (-),score=11.03 TRINITY_DN1972_c0_g1_i1:75-425(-)
MPNLSVVVSTSVAKETKAPLFAALTKSIATITGKPEKVVVIELTTSDISFGGDFETPAAFCNYTAIGGVNATSNKALTVAFTQALSEHLKIQADRIFCNFRNVDADHWGYNNGLVG